MHEAGIEWRHAVDSCESDGGECGCGLKERGGGPDWDTGGDEG